MDLEQEARELAVNEDALANVAHSAAVKELDALISSGKVNKARAEKARAQYEALHKALMRTMGADKQLLTRAKGLQQQLRNEDTRERSNSLMEESGLDSDARENESIQVVSLRAELIKAEHEAAAAREREHLLQLEMGELVRQRNNYQEQTEEIRAEAEAAIGPQLRRLKEEIAIARDESLIEGEKLAEVEKEASMARADLATVKRDLSDRQAQKAAESVELTKISLIPDKARKQANAMEVQLESLKQKDQNARDKIREQEAAASYMAQQVTDALEAQAKNAAALERLRVSTEHRHRTIEELEKHYEIAVIDGEHKMEERVAVMLNFKALLAELQMASDNVTRSTADKERALRKLKRAQSILAQAQQQIPNLRQVQQELTKEQQRMKIECRRAAQDVEELLAHLEVERKELLEEEKEHKKASQEVVQSYVEIGRLEGEVGDLKRQDAATRRQIGELASARTQMARTAQGKVEKWKEALEYVRTKEMAIVDMRKEHRAVLRRCSQYRQLYNLVRNQRNKFVNLIQASAQSIAEMKEKLKILGNEIEILLNEVLQKEKMLNKSVADNLAAHSERDKLRLDLDKSVAALRKKQVAVDEQIVDIERLGLVISSIEQEMVQLRKVYEAQVERRNVVGTTLIDRNDELCILYEKAHVQEEVKLQGDLSLQERDDEIRLLNIEISEVTRHRDVVRKLLPAVPQLDESIASLQQQLLEERRRVEDLSHKAESPDNLTRWRELPGHIPEQAELMGKINFLQERIEDKDSQLNEKALILDEVSTLSERLRQQATEGRQETIELATKVNHYQTRIRETTRKLMATVSELSMYQALSMKIKADRDSAEADVAAARARMDAGLAPNEDALREWGRLERERAITDDLRATKQGELDGPQHRSTAEARPNAYLGEDMGIPKPYGAYAPFKPTDAGATMRHIRKPEVRDIII